jgi:hypothetical protein
MQVKLKVRIVRQMTKMVDQGSLSKEGSKRLPFKEVMEKLQLKYISNKKF